MTDNLPGGVQALDYYSIYNNAQYKFKINNIHSKVIFVPSKYPYHLCSMTSSLPVDLRSANFMGPLNYILKDFLI